MVSGESLHWLISGLTKWLPLSWFFHQLCPNRPPSVSDRGLDSGPIDRTPGIPTVDGIGNKFHLWGKDEKRGCEIYMGVLFNEETLNSSKIAIAIALEYWNFSSYFSNVKIAEFTVAPKLWCFQLKSSSFIHRRDCCFIVTLSNCIEINYWYWLMK